MDFEFTFDGLDFMANYITKTKAVERRLFTTVMKMSNFEDRKKIFDIIKETHENEFNQWVYISLPRFSNSLENFLTTKYTYTPIKYHYYASKLNNLGNTNDIDILKNIDRYFIDPPVKPPVKQIIKQPIKSTNKHAIYVNDDVCKNLMIISDLYGVQPNKLANEAITSYLANIMSSLESQVVTYRSHCTNLGESHETV